MCHHFHALVTNLALVLMAPAHILLPPVSSFIYPDTLGINGDQRMDRASARKNDEHEFTTETLDLSEYIDYLKGTGALNGTIRKYCRTIERLVDLMDRVPEVWDADDLTRLMKEFSKPAPTRPNGYARSTRIIMKSALKRYWESTGRTDLIGPGPFWQNGRGHSRYEYIKAHTASPEEVEAILEECRRVILEPKSSPNEVIRHFMMFLVAGYGIRCKAVRYLRARDFNLQDRTLHIYRTKGDKSRTIYMDIPLDDLWPRVLISRHRLINQIQMTHSDKPELKERFEQVPWFFFTRMEKDWKSVGEQMHRSSVNSLVSYLTSKIVGRRISPHAFRHAKVFSLLDQGWKIERVAAYMGHNSVQTTFQYVSLGPDQMRAEAERVSNEGHQVVVESIDGSSKSTAASSLKTLFDQGILSKDEYLLKMESILGL